MASVNVGAVVSRAMAASTAVDQFPALSWTLAETVLMPSPAERVQAFEVLKVSGVDQVPVSFLNWITVASGEAVRFRVTAALLVREAPLLMPSVIVGAVVSRVMLATRVDSLAASSVPVTVMVLTPGLRLVRTTLQVVAVE